MAKTGLPTQVGRFLKQMVVPTEEYHVVKEDQISVEAVVTGKYQSSSPRPVYSGLYPMSSHSIRDTPWIPGRYINTGLEGMVGTGGYYDDYSLVQHNTVDHVTVQTVEGKLINFADCEMYKRLNEGDHVSLEYHPEHIQVLDYKFPNYTEKAVIREDQTVLVVDKFSKHE